MPLPFFPVGPRIQGASTRKWSTVPNEFRTRCPFPASTRWSRVEGGGRSTPYGDGHPILMTGILFTDICIYHIYIYIFLILTIWVDEHPPTQGTNMNKWEFRPQHTWLEDWSVFFFGTNPAPGCWNGFLGKHGGWRSDFWLINGVQLCNLTPLKIAIQQLEWSRESEESRSISSFGTSPLYRDYQHQLRQGVYSKTNPTAPAS